MHSLRYNYTSSCPYCRTQSYGKRLYIYDHHANNGSPYDTNINSSFANSNNNVTTTTTSGRDDASPFTGTPGVVSSHDLGATATGENQADYVNLASLSATERRILELRRKNGLVSEDGISTRQDPHPSMYQDPHSIYPTHRSHNFVPPSANELRLQEDNRLLILQMTELRANQKQLERENQRLSSHLEEMMGLEDSSSEQSDLGSCTDTEKELAKYKRHHGYLRKEIKILQEENRQFRQGRKRSSTSKKSNSDQNSSEYRSPITPEVDVNIEHFIDRVSDQKRQALISMFRRRILQIYREHEDLRRMYQQMKSATLLICSEMKSNMAQTTHEVLQKMSEVTSQNDKLMEKYVREMKLRKHLQNQLVELKGNIRVLCRVRPLIQEDSQGDGQPDDSSVVVWADPWDSGLVTVDQRSRLAQFDMDSVFGMDSSQEEVFGEVSSLVRSALDGYNVCIFAYGQTGSGKTYTMEGPPSNPGINQRALKLLFDESVQEDWSFHISASVLEIYNETIRDLLNPDASQKLEVRLNSEGRLHVPGLVATPVTCLEEVNQVFAIGASHRATASTNMNFRSSRSHCLLCVSIKGHNLQTGSITSSHLNLVDLAGSERVGKSQADGARLREAQNINKSLSCLGDVIHALRAKQSHVPYRNSKLTYLLQESLSGDSKTMMIVQVSPVEKNVCETVCTLNFGQRVRSVEMGTARPNTGLRISSPKKSLTHLNLSGYTSSNTSLTSTPSTSLGDVSECSTPSPSPSTSPSPSPTPFLKSPHPVFSPATENPKSPVFFRRQNSIRTSKSSTKSSSTSSLTRSFSFAPESTRTTSQNHLNYPRSQAKNITVNDVISPRCPSSSSTESERNKQYHSTSLTRLKPGNNQSKNQNSPIFQRRSTMTITNSSADVSKSKQTANRLKPAAREHVRQLSASSIESCSDLDSNPRTPRSEGQASDIEPCHTSTPRPQAVKVKVPGVTPLRRSVSMRNAGVSGTKTKSVSMSSIQPSQSVRWL